MAAPRFALGTCLGFLLALAAFQFPATAKADDIVTAVPSAFAGAGATPVEIHGITRAIAPRWRASFGLGRETLLASAMLRYDQTLAFGTRSDAASRDNWRHFLGIEYTPSEELGLSLLGGVAKSSGASKSSGLPTGYERLRLNAGLRWRSGEWGVESGFAFIPTGAGRVPGDVGYLPGMGDSSSSTYLFSLTVSRRF